MAVVAALVVVMLSQYLLLLLLLLLLPARQWSMSWFTATTNDHSSMTDCPHRPTTPTKVRRFHRPVADVAFSTFTLFLGRQQEHGERKCAENYNNTHIPI